LGLASQAKIIASLESFASLKGDIIDDVQRTITDLVVQNALQAQNKEAHDEIIAKLRDDIAERDAKLAARGGDVGEVGKKGSRAGSADGDHSAARGLQLSREDITVDDTDLTGNVGQQSIGSKSPERLRCWLTTPR
jgi:hypothetical protein